MALLHLLLPGLWHWLVPHIHPSRWSYCPLVHETTSRSYWDSYDRWLNWGDHISLDASTPLPISRIQVGNTNSGIHLSFPAKHVSLSQLILHCSQR